MILEAGGVVARMNVAEDSESRPQVIFRTLRLGLADSVRIGSVGKPADII